MKSEARVIKFRCWSPINGGMFYPHQTDNKKNKFFAGFNTAQGRGNIEVSRYAGKGSWQTLTLMQFTGFTDKEGVELYEEDVCDCDGIIGFIRWNHGSWEFKANDGSYIGLFAVANTMKKLGNSFENPELLITD